MRWETEGGQEGEKGDGRQRNGMGKGDSGQEISDR